MQRVILALFGWTSPNAITVFRGIMTIPVMISLAVERYDLVLMVGIAASILDFVDGALAEAQGVASPFGAFLDSTVDKVFVLGILVTLASCGHLHGLAIAVVIGIGLVGARLTYAHWRQLRRTGTDQLDRVSSTDFGKFKFIAEALALLAIVVGAVLHNHSLAFAGEMLLVLALILATHSLRDQLAHS